MLTRDSETTVERARGLVEKHSVHYEARPEEQLVDGKIVKIGFALELCGTHEHGETRMTPGCERCVQTFADLREIAEWIMPQQERPSRYEIAPFDSALHFSSTRKLRGEVVLTMKIVHRHGYFQPIDDCEQRCLAEMKKKLAELGARQGN